MKNIIKRIPEYFYIALYGELVSVFGPWIVPYPKIEASFNYTTVGWNEAFCMTCNKLNMKWLTDYKRSLSIEKMHDFGETIDANIISTVKKMNTDTNPYYEWIGKENRKHNQ